MTKATIIINDGDETYVYMCNEVMVENDAITARRCRIVWSIDD